MDILSPIRVGIVFLMLGWYIKADFYIPYLFSDIIFFPQRTLFFPLLMNNVFVAQVAFVIPLCFFLSLFFRELRIIRVFLVVMILCSLILACHADTYNDATFVVSFWSALWLFWLSLQSQIWVENNVNKVLILGQILVGMIFLGGVVGKCHASFLNGDVLYHIFIVQRNYWPFDWIKHTFSIPIQVTLAMVLSRIIIVMETFLALGFLWPASMYCIVGSIVMLMIIPFTTWRILSVLFPLLGILRVNWLLLKQKRKLDYA